MRSILLNNGPTTVMKGPSGVVLPLLQDEFKDISTVTSSSTSSFVRKELPICETAVFSSTSPASILHVVSTEDKLVASSLLAAAVGENDAKEASPQQMVVTSSCKMACVICHKVCQPYSLIMHLFICLYIDIDVQSII